VQQIKVSIVTVSFNAERTIERCIQSVLSQTYKNVEYIVIDGKSTDKTVQIIHNFKNSIHRFLSEPDHGIYDAMNKGIRIASGDIVGMLNADDFFTGDDILSDVAAAFTDDSIQLLYGDLDYINADGKIVRKWRSGSYKPGAFNRGWMPPHPTFYCRRELFEQYGPYRLDLGTAADYELMLRFIHKYQMKVCYLQSVMINMEQGGASNKNWKSRLSALQNDFRAMQINGVSRPLAALIAKPLRKISQYF
jgi:glycosyltransferase involved in cell wall biosynthesis